MWWVVVVVDSVSKRLEQVDRSTECRNSALLAEHVWWWFCCFTSSVSVSLEWLRIFFSKRSARCLGLGRSTVWLVCLSLIKMNLKAIYSKYFEGWKTSVKSVTKTYRFEIIFIFSVSVGFYNSSLHGSSRHCWAVFDEYSNEMLWNTQKWENHPRLIVVVVTNHCGVSRLRDHRMQQHFNWG